MNWPLQQCGLPNSIPCSERKKGCLPHTHASIGSHYMLQTSSEPVPGISFPGDPGHTVLPPLGLRPICAHAVDTVDDALKSFSDPVLPILPLCCLSSARRCPPWAVAVTMSWMPFRSVSSTPRSRVHRSATLHGGSSLEKRSSHPGTTPRRTTWPPTSSTSRWCEESSLGSTDVRR